MPRHDLDAISLIAGVLFSGVALVSLMTRTAGLTGRWTWPVLLIVAGVVGLLASRQDDDPER